jgi:hypothetical protein
MISFPKPAKAKKKINWIKKIGKYGKINIKANRKLKILYSKLDLPPCEIKRSRCWNECQGFVHRHKRGWYKGKEELLSSLNQTLKGCNQCHSEIEYDKKETERLFLKLRGLEIKNTLDRL